MPIAEPSNALADASAVNGSRSKVTVPTVVDTTIPVPVSEPDNRIFASPSVLPANLPDDIAGFAEAGLSTTTSAIPTLTAAAPCETSVDSAVKVVKTKLNDVCFDDDFANSVKPVINSANTESSADQQLGSNSSTGSSNFSDQLVPVQTNGDAAISKNLLGIAQSLQNTSLNDSLNQNSEEQLDKPSSSRQDSTVTDDSVDTEAWRSEERHVFVLSSSGKPVYTRHGSEDKLVTLFGVMQALVSIVEDSDDKIESIHFGTNVIVFQIRGPLILVAVSKKDDSVLFCNNQLTYVYNQIISVLTLKQVVSIFEKRRNYDLRRLLTGSERLIDHLLQFYESEPSIFMDGVACVPMPSAHRKAVSSAIKSSCSKIKNLVFVVLVANNKLISLVRKREYLMTPADLHLILNMVAASESLKTAESWTPICLPDFNADGFLYAHVSYLSDDCPACLLLLTVDQEIFFQLSEAKKKITEKLTENKSMSLINEVLKAPPSLWLSLSALGLREIRHFIYKCKKTSNVVSSPMAAPYKTPREAAALFTKYQKIYTEVNESNPPVTTVFQVSAEETIVCLVTDKFEILVSVEPTVKKQFALAMITKLSSWVQSEEDRFFISKAVYL